MVRRENAYENKSDEDDISFRKYKIDFGISKIEM